MAPKKTATKGKKKTQIFQIDCTAVVADGILDMGLFEKYLVDHIKVDGKTGNLGDAIKVTRDSNNIQVTASRDFSKRYLKYLTKRFLKKRDLHQNIDLRDYLRVVATAPNKYQLKYFNVAEEE
eukprot:Clim_evm12s223 gene=Clim_evmTU12s223